MPLRKIIFNHTQPIELCCLKTINATPRGMLSSYVTCVVCANHITPEKSCDMVSEKNLKLKDNQKDEGRELVGLLFNEELYTESKALSFTKNIFEIHKIKTCAVSVYRSRGLLRISTVDLDDMPGEPRVCLMATGVLGVFTQLLPEAI